MFGASKQAYYQYSEKGFEKRAIARFIIEYVQEVRQTSPQTGGEKLWTMFNTDLGKRYHIGRDAFLKVLKQHNLMLKPSKRGCQTTDSTHHLPLYPNLVDHLGVDRSNQVWVSDITYIPLPEGRFCFLSLVTDSYDHQIVGWHVGDTLATTHTLEALNQACRERQAQDRKRLIHHSDRGVQYASFKYIEELKQQGMRISMTQSGNPKDNAIAERVNGILKKEFLNLYEFDNIQQVTEAVQEAVEFYNTKRPHRSLDMLTPKQAVGKTGILKKRWKSYKDKYREIASG